MPTVSIIIPVYNALEFARKCLDSVFRAATRVPFEVIVVDNGSSAPVVAWLHGQRRRHTELITLRFDQPLGFARAVNEGARHARHPYLVVLNSDCMVGDGWLDGLVSAMEADPRIGVASPVTNHCGPGSQVVAQPPDGGIPHATIYEPHRLFFFCVMIRRRVWEALGGLDEVYQAGTYEDDDFCLRARLAGWSMAVVPEVYVWNERSRTFQENGIDRDEWLFRNETVFLEKASRLSGALRPLVTGKPDLLGTSVLVTVPQGMAARLTCSLASLDNQTVRGFETLVVCARGQELAIPEELERRLGVRRIMADGRSLWNAALKAAQGRYLAFLPAGDIYFPYHLEMLHRSLLANGTIAAHSNWSVAIHSQGSVVRAPVRAYQDWPLRLRLAPWAALVSWICHRGLLPEGGFREELGSFASWDFTLRLEGEGVSSFEPFITCERNRWREDPREEASLAAIVMKSFPVAESWAAGERLDLLRAIDEGIWEESLVIKRRDRERRARRMFQQRTAPPCPIQQARSRMAAVPATEYAGTTESGRFDLIFFNILRWDDLTQRPHHFATGLARRGHRVFWIDIMFVPVEEFTGTVHCRELSAGVLEIRLPGLAADVYRLGWTPDLLELACDAMDQVRRSARISAAVQMVNFPGWTPLAEVMRQRFGWPIVYDCLDDQYEFSDLHEQTAAAYEAELTTSCDALITSGKTLYANKLITRGDVVLIPNAADYELFRNCRPQQRLNHVSRPVVGFFGALADWLDSDWIGDAARRYPRFSFVFIGPEIFAASDALERWRSATSMPNVHVLPKTPIADLPGYLAQFDVSVIPFLDLPITRAMNPVKIYEYLAAGKHVLAPALPEIQPLAELGLLVTYRDREESFRHLEELAFHPPTSDQFAQRTTFAARNDWSERVDRLLEVAGRVPIPGR